MKHLPTDREILRTIFEHSLREYPGSELPNEKHSNDPYLPLDMPALANSLACSQHLLFGRLHYYITPKHRHAHDVDREMPLFTPRAGQHRHAVNFPYLTSVLATYEEEHQRHIWTIKLSALSLGISFAALLFSVLAYWLNR